MRRKMTEADFAERVGIARSTLRAIEAGSLKSEIGLVFEAAAIAGVDLFRDDNHNLVPQIARLDDKLALLPRRVRVVAAELKTISEAHDHIAACDPVAARRPYRPFSPLLRLPKKQ